MAASVAALRDTARSLEAGLRREREANAAFRESTRRRLDALGKKDADDDDDARVGRVRGDLRGGARRVERGGLSSLSAYAAVVVACILVVAACVAVTGGLGAVFSRAAADDSDSSPGGGDDDASPTETRLENTAVRVVPGASDVDIDGDLSRTRTELEDEIDALRREMDARDAKRNARDERAGEKLEDAIEKTGEKLETLERREAAEAAEARTEEKKNKRSSSSASSDEEEEDEAKADALARSGEREALEARFRAATEGAEKTRRRDDRPASASASDAPVVKLEDMPGFAAATGLQQGLQNAVATTAAAVASAFSAGERAVAKYGSWTAPPVPLIRGGRFRRGNDRRRRGAAFAPAVVRRGRRSLRWTDAAWTMRATEKVGGRARSSATSVAAASGPARAARRRRGDAHAGIARVREWARRVDERLGGARARAGDGARGAREPRRFGRGGGLGGFRGFSPRRRRRRPRRFAAGSRVGSRSTRPPPRRRGD